MRAGTFCTLLVLLAASAAALGASCEGAPIDPAPTALTCDATQTSLEDEVVPIEDITVYLDLPDGPNADAVERDLTDVLGRMWGQAPAIVRGREPALDAPLSIWISDTDAAKELVEANVTQGYEHGYSLLRSDAVLLAYGSDEHYAAVGAYGLLEMMGARFFHPMEDLVPAYGEARIPTGIDVDVEPAFETRGLQLHTLHPIEYFEPLTVPGEENLANAKRLVDWLVKTGHNEMQWWIMEARAEGWAEHTTAIIEYANARGVEVGALMQLSQASNLQRGYGLVDDGATLEEGEAQVRQRLDAILDVPWNRIELTMGEFLGGDPASVVAWLDAATVFLADRDPPIHVSVVNHVGGDLYVDYQGQNVFFYFLPQFADARLENNVHTVFFFDLYRPWGGYNHEDFFDHREYLFEQLGTRPMSYTPESAYWASADIDVPIFLPSYLTARWNDITGLVRDPMKMGLPPVKGHILFSSGHEWGYWLTDYLTARMLWHPDEPIEATVSHVTDAFGSCGEELGTALLATISLQDEFLFDRRLAGYLSGEDLADDAGAALDIFTTPRRRAYEEVAALEGEEREAFITDVVDALEEFATRSDLLTEDFRAACERPDERSANFCAELVDASEITALRAHHSERLYRAVLASEDKDAARLFLADATLIRERAAAVIARREAGYRFPVEKLVEPFENASSYQWGYLRQAHLLCFWDRQAMQATNWVEYGAFGFVGLPTCSD